MRIISSSIAHISCSKKPDKVFDIISSDFPVDVVTGCSDIELKESLNVVTSLSFTFKSKDEKEEIAFLNMFVSVNLELSPEDIKDEEKTKKAIPYFAANEAWPIFKNHFDILSYFKIDFKDFPLPPSKEIINEHTSDK